MFRVVTAQQDVLKALIVRGVVFIEEQGVAYDGEIDDFESEAVHILGELEGEPVAAGRLRFMEDWAKLERIAVRPRWRGCNHGRQAVHFMLEEARRRGYRRFKLHAQAHLTDFYREFGFVTEGDIFDECGIDHYLMTMRDL